MDEWNDNTLNPANSTAPSDENPMTSVVFAPSAPLPVPPAAPVPPVTPLPAGPPPFALSVDDKEIKKGAGWGKFFSVMLIINGAFTCLGIITIPIGVFIIMGGVSLMRASERLTDIARDKAPQNVSVLISELCAFNRRMGISIVISLVFMVLSIVVIILIAVVAAINYPSYSEYFNS